MHHIGTVGRGFTIPARGSERRAGTGRGSGPDSGEVHRGSIDFVALARIERDLPASPAAARRGARRGQQDRIERTGAPAPGRRRGEARLAFHDRLHDPSARRLRAAQRPALVGRRVSVYGARASAAVPRRLAGADHPPPLYRASKDLEATNINIGFDTVEVRSTEALAKADTSSDTGRVWPRFIGVGTSTRHSF